MIVFLVKVFSDQVHAGKFLQGEMYARRLSWFKELENDTDRGDDHEAAVVSHLDGFTITLNPTDLATGETEEVTITGSDLARPPVFRPRHFDHLHLFCMYAAQIDSNHEIPEDRIQELKKQLELPEEYSRFGRNAVAIINYSQFVKRVEVAAKRNGYGIGWGPVEYFDPEVGTSLSPLDVKTLFAKRNKYAWQKEFRFVIDSRTVGNDALILNIGKIDDIATALDTSEINRLLSIEPGPKA